MTLCKKLTIFEGVDGSGKSTAAKAYAAATGAIYTHFPALPNVKQGLARLYLEAMLPALLGYKDVVFDRCWMSEKPYGAVFREGKLRLDDADVAMLERVAMRCQTAVVYCETDQNTMRTNFATRNTLGGEYLRNTDQWEQVFGHYTFARGQSQLPTIRYDYQKSDVQTLLKWLDGFGTAAHLVAQPTVGNREAEVCLVGEAFAERKDQDPWHQWPFVSFSRQGCSHWLAEYLMAHKIDEAELSWANADFDLKHLGLKAKVYIALGASAAKALEEADLPYILVPHPQHQKRFNNHADYVLAARLRAVLKHSLAEPA